MLPHGHILASTSSMNYSPMQIVVAIVIGLITLVSMWKIYEKAKQPGWSAIIPIYNVLVQLRIVKRPWWWLILLIIPFINVIFGIIITYDLAKAFGKGVGYTLLLIFLPFIGYPMLAFGDATYQPALLER